MPSEITPVHCLSYVLAQAGVATTVPGVRDSVQLAGVLGYLDATNEDKDFSAVLAGFQEYVAGECVYCNHCLPCPVGIDIGQVIRLADTAAYGLTPALRAEYAALSAWASACLECGDCTTRCPFGVDAIAQMHRAVALFE